MHETWKRNARETRESRGFVAARPGAPGRRAVGRGRRLFPADRRGRPRERRGHGGVGPGAASGETQAGGGGRVAAGVRVRPGDAGLRCELGDAWLDLGHPREALPVYAEATRLAPDPGAGMVRRGLRAPGQRRVRGGGPLPARSAAARAGMERGPAQPRQRALQTGAGGRRARRVCRQAARGPRPEMSLAMIALVVPGEPAGGQPGNSGRPAGMGGPGGCRAVAGQTVRARQGRAPGRQAAGGVRFVVFPRRTTG